MLRPIVCLVAGFATLALAACGSAAPTPSPTSPPKAAAPAAPAAPATTAPAQPAAPAKAAAPTVIKLGGVEPLTDQSAAYGTRAQHGAELAVKQINEAGGITDKDGNKYTLQISANDMANDRNQAIALTQRLADDKSVLAIIGPSSSTGFVPMVPVAGQVKIPIVGVGTQAVVKEWNPYSYRINPSVEIGGTTLFEKLHKQYSIKKLAILYDQTQDGQAGAARSVRDRAKALGVDVAAFEALRSGDQDFTTQLTTIKATGTEWLSIYAPTPECAKASRQARDLGIKATIITEAATSQDPVAWDLSDGALNGSFTWSGLDVSSSAPGVVKFVKDYKAVYPDEPTGISGYGYDAVIAVADAIKRAGTATDRAKLIAAMGNTELRTGTIGGNVTWKNPPNGENLTPQITPTKTTARGKFDVMPW